MKPQAKTYAAESVGSVMSVNVPIFSPNTALHEILHQVTVNDWDSIRNVFIVDSRGVLKGYIDLAALIHSNHGTRAAELMKPATDVLHTNDDQEKAVFFAVKDNDVVLPVIDDNGVFLGAVTARRIISIMHDEHIEDALLSTGIHKGKRGTQIAKLATERATLIVRSRLPWLTVGLVAGLGLSLISSFFEKSLEQTITLAFFIPVVAYVADSVGTQSEAIMVRALATFKINPAAYLLKELLVGLILGMFVGAIGGAGAFLIGQAGDVALVVGLSLAVASTIAAVLGALIPILFRAAGKDPALGSGPLATALQDTISIVIYFLFAIWIIG